MIRRCVALPVIGLCKPRRSGPFCWTPHRRVAIGIRLRACRMAYFLHGAHLSQMLVTPESFPGHHFSRNRKFRRERQKVRQRGACSLKSIPVGSADPRRRYGGPRNSKSPGVTAPLKATFLFTIHSGFIIITSFTIICAVRDFEHTDTKSAERVDSNSS